METFFLRSVTPDFTLQFTTESLSQNIFELLESEDEIDSFWVRMRLLT